MPPRNVLPFKSPRSSQGWEVRVFTALFYLAMAWLIYPVTSGSLTVVIVAAVLYALFLHRQIHRTGYLRQNALLLGIMLVLLLTVFWQVLLPLLVLTGIFWVMIWRVYHDTPFFVRYHLLTALILDLGLVLALLILEALLGFLGALWSLGPVSLFPAFSFLGVGSGYGLLCLALIWGSAIYLAVLALLGRTPFIPFVSAQVRHWT